MSVVIDANLLVALALNDPRAAAVDQQLREWAAAGETLHAPELLRYEAANALTRAVVAGHLARDRAAYHAAYVILAQSLGAELWTLDGPLARNARGLGMPVRLVASE